MQYISWPASLQGIGMLSDWSVVREIGYGRYGHVYEICRRDGSEHAALKWIPLARDHASVSIGVSPEDLALRNEVYKNRYLEEFRIMSQLQGESNLVSCQDYTAVQRSDNSGWDLLIRMEMLKPLKEHIRVQGLTLPTVLDIGKSIAAALKLCHDKGIIHGDVKIENCFFARPGVYKLGDFGLSFIHRQQEVGSGTPAYLAPECADGQQKTPFSDQYAWGIMIYTLLNDVQLPIGTAPYSCPSRCNNRQLWEIIARALSDTPEKRYPSMTALLEALSGLPTLQTGKTWFPKTETEHTEAVGGNTRSDMLQRSVTMDRKAGQLAGTALSIQETAEAKNDADEANDCVTETISDRVKDELEKKRMEDKRKKRKRIWILCIVVGGVLLIGAGVIFTLYALKPPPDVPYNGEYHLTTTPMLWRYTIRDGVSPENALDQKICTDITVTSRGFQTDGKGYFLRILYQAPEDSPESLPVTCNMQFGEQTAGIKIVMVREKKSAILVLNEGLKSFSSGNGVLVCKLYAQEQLLTELSYPLSVE